MNDEDIEAMIAAVRKKEAAAGEEISQKDLDDLRKLWSGEITIDEYMIR